MKFLAAGLLAYFVYVVVMVVIHPRLVYTFRDEDRVLPGFARIELKGADGASIFVQEHPGDGPVLLYFMGNIGTLPFFTSAFQRHIAAGRHVIALEYRGGGGRPGSPSETVLKSDALIAADVAFATGKPVVVQGYPLGSGLATHVAARRDVAAVILVAPYDRLCKVMSTRAWLPACWLPFVQKWNSLGDAENITAPVLVLHGTKDEIIAPRFSTGLGDLPGTNRVLIEGAFHGDIGNYPRFDAEIDAVFAPFEP